MQHLSLPVVVAALVAILLSFTRVAAASKPLWALLPGWLQVALPQALVVATALEQKLADTAGVQSWTDFAVILVASFALIAPGAPSHRSDAPLPSNSSPPSSPKLVGLTLCLVLALTLQACAALSAVVPILSEVATDIADAVNVLDVVQQEANAFFAAYPDAQAQAVVNAKILAARYALAAAAKADQGATDLTEQQADASLDAFRQAWSDLQQAIDAAGLGKPKGNALAVSVSAVPQPLALRHLGGAK